MYFSDCFEYYFEDLLYLPSSYWKKRGEKKNKKQDPDVVSNDSVILFQNSDLFLGIPRISATHHSYCFTVLCSSTKLWEHTIETM